MAQYRASIKGQRGEASRFGGKTSGISACVNGWQLGVSVSGSYDKDTDSDEFIVDITAGSGGRHIGEALSDIIITERRNGAGQLTGFTIKEKPAEIADGA